MIEMAKDDEADLTVPVNMIVLGDDQFPVLPEENISTKEETREWTPVTIVRWYGINE